MKRTLPALLIAALLTAGLVHPSRVAACDCVESTPQQLVAAADTIVVAKVKSVGNSPGNFKALVSVERYLKGGQGMAELIVDIGTASSCGIGPWLPERRFLLFFGQSGYRVSMCDGSTDITGFQGHGTPRLQVIEAVTGSGAPPLPPQTALADSNDDFADYLAAVGVSAGVLLLAASAYFLTRRIMTAR